MAEREPHTPEEGRQPESEEIPKALFDMGQIVVTAGAIETLTRIVRHPVQLLARHVTGDWGNLPEEDIEENKYSLQHGFRIFSAYVVDGAKFYVITEWDRSVTTLLLPEEY